MSSTTALKSELRKATVAKILALDPGARKLEERRLFEIFKGLEGFRTAETVLLFASAFVEEIDTTPYLAFSLEKRKRLILPRMDRTAGSLSLHEVKDLETDLRKGPMGILEPRKSLRSVDPDQVDWALVPGLAFDDQARRLGRGGGYYDRFLPSLRFDVFKTALILDAQWVDVVPVEAHDRPLDLVLSVSKTVAQST